MIKLLDLIKEILQEGNNPFGKVVYHGSSKKFDLNSLDIDRKSIARGSDGRFIRETGSEKTGVGLYVSLALWMNSKKNILNPIYKDGLAGNESAEKYAHISNDGFPDYIYKIVLSDGINLEKYGYKNIDGKNISKEQKDKLLAEGIDGLYDTNEAVILNKDKIESLDIAYIAEDLMTRITPIKMDEIKSWNDVPDTGGRAIILMSDIYKQVQMSNENVDKYLKETLKVPYILKLPSSKDYIATNAPKEVTDAVYNEEWDDEKNMTDTTKQDEARKKYPVGNYKFYYIQPYDGFYNWKKVNT
jgi:hypothetical protein